MAAAGFAVTATAQSNTVAVPHRVLGFIAWQPRVRLALSLCLFAIVLGANWALALRFGSDIPDMDQWDAEGVYLLAPWYEQGQRLAPILQPHNEHRVILTKLQNLALIAVGGHWDSRVECAVNAVLHALIAVGLWGFARTFLRGGLAVGAYILIALIYGLPLAWQNLLGGFHSQQYWLVGLALLTIGWLSTARSWSARWWLGALAALLSLASMGSGFFGSAIVLLVLGWRWATRDVSLRAVWPTLLLCLGLVVIGFSTRLEVDYHETLKAKTAEEFFLYLARSLEWPLRGQTWAGLVLWAPWVLLIGGIVRAAFNPRKAGGTPALPGMKSGNDAMTQLITAAMGAWVLLQLVATAYTRGAGAHYPASRYMDTLMVGAVANGLALGLLLSRPMGSGSRQAAVAGGVAWAIVLGTGLFGLSRTNLQEDLPGVRDYYARTERHLRGYLATGNVAELRHPIPYLNSEGLIARLNHPALSARMPSTVRPPLRLETATHATGTSAFERNEATELEFETAARAGLSPRTPPLPARTTWGSYTETAGRNTTGEWRSSPLPPPAAGWLRFEVAGDVGVHGTRLQLVDAADGTPLADIQPSKQPGEAWRTAYVRSPTRPFVVAAADASRKHWLAFSAPVEMTSLSYWSWRLMKHGMLLTILAGLAAAGLSLVATRGGLRRE